MNDGTNDVAVEAGVTRRTIYNKFRNKKELLRAVVHSVNVEMRLSRERRSNAIQAIPGPSRSGSGPAHKAAARTRPILAAGQGLPQPDRKRFRQALSAVLRQNQDLLKTERESRLAAAELTQAANTESQLRDRLQSAVLDFATGLPVREQEILIQCLVRSGMLPRQPKTQAAPQQLQ